MPNELTSQGKGQSRLRIAVLSFWHVHAADYAKLAMEHPDTELAAVWDNDPQRGQREAALRGVPYFSSLEQLLADRSIDGVIVTEATTRHPGVLIAAAKAGKAIFTEKVVALTQADCLDIMQASDEAGVAMVVSLPRLNLPFVLGMAELAQSGLLGGLTLARARLSHSGALPSEAGPNGYLPDGFFTLSEAGGGAMMDLGCHPMSIVRHLLGMPASVSAAFGHYTGKEVEDNAVVTLQYGSGAIGIVEAGFVNRSSPFTLELHGTEGSAIYCAKDGKLMYKSALLDGEQAKQWHEYALPEARPNAFAQWVNHIRSGTRADANLAAALDLTRLMEAASKSARLGKTIQL
jgi:1,5-anhydro-D-fructose reductase (1,5-anhydro-D-mannitol-forming)